MSAVPLYGYFVHAARDSQQVGLLIILCWVLTCAFFVYLLVVIVVRRFRGQDSSRIRYLASYLLVLGIIGYGGVNKAFFELIAG